MNNIKYLYPLFFENSYQKDPKLIQFPFSFSTSLNSKTSSPNTNNNLINFDKRYRTISSNATFLPPYYYITIPKHHIPNKLINTIQSSNAISSRVWNSNELLENKINSISKPSSTLLPFHFVSGETRVIAVEKATHLNREYEGKVWIELVKQTTSSKRHQGLVRFAKLSIIINVRTTVYTRVHAASARGQDTRLSCNELSADFGPVHLPIIIDHDAGRQRCAPRPCAIRSMQPFVARRGCD